MPTIPPPIMAESRASPAYQEVMPPPTLDVMLIIEAYDSFLGVWSLSSLKIDEADYWRA